MVCLSLGPWPIRPGVPPFSGLKVSGNPFLKVRIPGFSPIHGHNLEAGPGQELSAHPLNPNCPKIRLFYPDFIYFDQFSWLFLDWNWSVQS